MKKKKLYTMIGVCSLFVILSISYCLLCKTLKDTVIWENVYINGILLTGLTREEAEEAILEDFKIKYKDISMTFQISNREFSSNVFPIFGLDASAEINKAYKLGHNKWYLRGIDLIKKHVNANMVSGITILPYAKHPEKLKEIIENSGVQKYSSVVESTWDIGETNLVIHKGQVGNVVDLDQFQKNIITEINNHNYAAIIECPLKPQKPREIDIQSIYEQAYREAENATLDKNDGYKITSSIDGVTFDTKAAKEAYEKAAEGTDVIIDFEIKKPTVTTEDLNNNLFKDVLASYSTYGGGTANRIANITLASNACNEIILLPGEIFSYNDTLGPRTEDKGYKPAGAYLNNEVVQEIGGGICQVSSTLFATVLHTNLEILQRQNHSKTVSYLPLGMDATVSWGGPDLHFKNNMNYPIKLSVSYANGAVTVQIIGTHESTNTIDVTTKDMGDLKVETYRNHYDSQGNLISIEKIAYSHYKN